MFDLRGVTRRAAPNLERPGPTAGDVVDGNNSMTTVSLQVPFLIPIILVLGILLAFWSVNFYVYCGMEFPLLVIN